MVVIVLESETNEQKYDLSNVGNEKMHKELGRC